MKKVKTITLTARMLVILLIAATCCFTIGCKPSSTKTPPTYVEPIKPYDEGIFGVVESYTSGTIVSGEPLTVSFAHGLTLKKKYGEVLPSKIFTFEPQLRGEVTWLSPTKIAFVPEKIQEGVVYKGSLDLNEIVDVKAKLDFTFMVMPQDFRLGNILWEVTSQSANVMVEVLFLNNIDPNDVLKMMPASFVEQNQVSVTMTKPNQALLTFSDVPVNEKDYTLTLELDGAAIGVDKKCKTDITKPSSFQYVSHVVNYLENRLDIYFSQPLNPKQAHSAYVSTSPTVPFQSFVKDNVLSISFAVDGDVTWDNDKITVTILPGLSNADGTSLGAPCEINDISFSGNTPKVRWKNSGSIVSNIASPTLFFEARALKSATIRIIRIYGNNVIRFLQDNDISETYGIRKVGRLEKKIKIKLDAADPLKWTTYPIVLSDYVELKPGDMYSVNVDFGIEDYVLGEYEAEPDDVKKEINYYDNLSYDYKTYHYDDDYWWRNSKNPNKLSYYNNVDITKNVLVSDLAVTLKKLGNDDKLCNLFVYRISDGKPHRGSKVTVYNYQLQPTGTGTTDANGFVSITCSERPCFVEATDNSGNNSWLRISESNVLSYSKFDVGGNVVPNDIDGFIYSNRGVWRPGDPIELNFILSDKNHVLPPNYPVVMELYDASGMLYARKTNNSPVGNIYSNVVETKPSDATGMWKVCYKLANQTFSKTLRVETVKPNRLDIHMNLPKVLSLQEEPTIQLSAKWLSGLVASGLKATVDVSIASAYTSFEKYPEYTFENEAFSSSYYESKTLFSGKLNSQGKATFDTKALDDINGALMLNANFTIKVFEPGGDFSITSRQAKVAPKSLFVGVAMPKSDDSYYSNSWYYTGEDKKFPVLLLDANGNLVREKKKLTYDLYRISDYWWWSSYNTNTLQQYTTGKYMASYRSGIFDVIDGKASFNINVDDRRSGIYLLVLRDDAGVVYFSKVIGFSRGYYYDDDDDDEGGDYALSESPALLPLRVDKEEYSLGETVKVSFPANERSTAMVTIESASRILKQFSVSDLSKDGVIQFEATADMIPNVYVYVSLIQPFDNSNDLPIRMYGIQPVVIKDASKHLEPMVEVAKESRSQRPLDITVSEKNGKAMYYTLAIVDEGVLGITNYKTPDPWDHFTAKQALHVRTWDNYKDVLNAYVGELGTLYAVGGDADAFDLEKLMNDRFKAIACTMGPFELKAGQTAKHQFDIPVYAGSLRLMVVSAGPDNSYGMAQSNTKVIDPITLMPSAPRVVAPGDEVVMNVQVLSPDNKGKTLSVKTTLENLEVVDRISDKVVIEEDGQGIVAMRIKVPNKSGVAALDVEVSQGKDKASCRVEIPIRLPFAQKYDKLTKVIEGGATEVFDFDMDGVVGSFEGDVMVTTGVPVDLSRRLNYLVTYPHGCLEQTTSGVFPQLYLDFFMPLDGAAKANIDDNIKAGIARIKTFMRSDGSLLYWPDQGCNYVAPWPEVYALHFLVEAKRLGYDVPSHILDAIVSCQTRVAQNWTAGSGDESTQAYRLFVLSLNQTADVASMNRFAELKHSYAMSKVLLAAAYAQIGKVQMAKDIMPKAEEITDGKSSNYYNTYGSVSRDGAYYVYAKMLCDMTDVEDGVMGICQRLNSDKWMSTQTTAVSLFTLGRYFEMKGYHNAPISCQISVDKDSYDLSTNRAFINKDFQTKAGANRVEVTNNAESDVTAVLSLKYKVAEYETEEKGNVYAMKVHYTDKDGKPINLKTLTRGTDVIAVITVTNTGDISVKDNALTYILPSGWEVVNDRLLGGNNNSSSYIYRDIRDDRVMLYFDLGAKKTKTFYIPLNATFAGSYMIPSVYFEDMYDNTRYYVIPATKTIVR